MGDRRKDSDDYGERTSGWHYSLGWGDGTESVAPYVPTPLNVVREMLILAEVGPNDVLYDLGCGDGRILLTAVEEFDIARAVGFELNQRMVEATRLKIEDKELGDRIKVVEGSFFEEDLSEASVVTLYLTTSGNAKLKPKFMDELHKGARIVSHDFPIVDWVTAKHDHGFYTVGSHKIYLYKIPQAYTLKPPEKRDNEEDRWDRIKRLFDRLDRG
ncbi:methyltransferase domain-containing protein [Candidatus Bathyarchaeota archaeon]|nr:methyltransferase domain-containing protein [Candidatus Bathyarchaeota archaeon]